MYRIAIITVSDRSAAGQRDDLSGPAIRSLVGGLGIVVAENVVADEQDQIEQLLRRLADEQVADLILTTGGTGLSPRDVTPEATLAVADRLVPGIPEAIRAASLALTDRAMLSRAAAGIRGRALIVNLPGSPRAVRECLAVILPVLPHALGILTGSDRDCG
jgi:molybdenum cofactor synthesis domain-containing protein